VGLRPDAREERRLAIHEPYHQAIAGELQRRRATGARPVLVALHSFTPRLDGAQRPWQLGLLHDEGDTTLTRALLGRLRQEPQLCVGDNEPYRMAGPTTRFRGHAYPAGVRYLEVEFRQDLLRRSGAREAVGAPVRGWLRDAMALL